MLDLLGSLPVAVIVTAGICAPLAGWFAMQRARSPVAWFVYGALSGPLALLLLALAPPGRCPSCDTAVDGWATACARCGSAIGPWWGPLARSAGGEEVGRPAGAGPATASPATASPVAASMGSPAHEPGAVPTRAPAWQRSSDGARSAPTEPRAMPSVAPSRFGDPPPPRSMAPAPPVQIVPPPTRRPVLPPSTTPIPTTALYGSTTDQPPAGEVLVTGIYLSGNAGLEVGAVYALCRDADRLRLFGPVDTGKHTVCLDRPLEEIETVAVDDRVVITARRGRSSTDVILRWMGGMRPAELVAVLSSATSASNDADRVSG